MNQQQRKYTLDRLCTINGQKQNSIKLEFRRFSVQFGRKEQLEALRSGNFKVVDNLNGYGLESYLEFPEEGNLSKVWGSKRQEMDGLLKKLSIAHVKAQDSIMLGGNDEVLGAIRDFEALEIK